MTDYPHSLPCPLVATYKGDIDFGFSTVSFNRGNKRRRRLATVRLEKYDITFTFTTQQLWQFQAWANLFGYDWHYMPIVTHFSGFINPTGPLLHRVRIISDLAITAIGADTFNVKLSIEVDTASRPFGIIAPSGNWIIGGTPPLPSSPDRIIAGTPPSPSTELVMAGTPVVPAA
jgi:hypothetical protein